MPDFDPNSGKHQLMRELLMEFQVDNPEDDIYYSKGSTVTTEALRTVLQRLKRYKANLRGQAQTFLDFVNQ